jgi:hypothetical protein
MGRLAHTASDARAQIAGSADGAADKQHGEQ